MNKAATYGIWKKLVVFWLLPWFLYTILLVSGMVPLWIGVLAPFLVATVYSRYTASSFTVPKFLAMILYTISGWFAILSWLLEKGGQYVDVPIPILGFILIVILLSFRGIRSWLSYMGSTERALGGITYIFAALYGMWIYILLRYKLMSLQLLLWIILIYSLYHLIIYILQISGIAFRMELKDQRLRPGSFIGTIGNPLTLNINILFATFLGVLALDLLFHIPWLSWLYSILGLLLVLYNTKRSVIVGAAVYVFLFPIFLWFFYSLPWYLVILYYLAIAGGFYVLLQGNFSLSQRIRGTIFPLLYAWNLKKVNIHPQVKYFAIATTTTRLYLIISGIKTWLRSPIWGFGFEYVRRYLMEYRAVETYYAEHRKGYDRSHNMYVDLLIEGGLVGLPVFFILLYMIGRYSAVSPPALLIWIVILSVLFFAFWDIVFIYGLSFPIAMVLYAYSFPVYEVPLSGIVFLLVLMVFVLIFSIFRHVSDMFNGFSRANIVKSLDDAKEGAEVALAIMPYQDENVVWWMEVVVKYLQALEASGRSPAVAGRLAARLVEYVDHIKITNYPDTFLAYIGYAYGILHRLGCQECLEKALFYFDKAMEINPFNEATVSAYANFLGNIGQWDKTCEILEKLIYTKYTPEPFQFLEQLKEVIYDYSVKMWQFVKRDELPETFDIDSAVKGRISWQAGRISPNLMKMYIYCLVEKKDYDRAKEWLRFYEALYKDADPAYIDEMFLKIKLGQLRNI